MTQMEQKRSGCWSHLLVWCHIVVSGSQKFDRGLGQILHDQLYWLDLPDPVLFKLAVTVYVFELLHTTVSVGALHSGLQC